MIINKNFGEVRLSINESKRIDEVLPYCQKLINSMGRPYKIIDFHGNIVGTFRPDDGVKKS